MTKQPDPEQIVRRARNIRLLVLDVDGVLTDGKLYYSNSGDEMKAFNTLDGQGLKLLQAAGITVALVSGRTSELLPRRAGNLGIELVYQGREDKPAVLDEILAKLELDYRAVAYVGDDLPDLACIKKAAMGVAVPNGHFLIKEHADFITANRGGEGAVREVCDWILQAQGTFEDAIEPYL